MGLFSKREDEEENEPYETDVTCQNCNEDNTLEIPYGKSVDAFLREGNNNVCEYCGCPIRKL